jgi:hypothetical protein
VADSRKIYRLEAYALSVLMLIRSWFCSSTLGDACLRDGRARHRGGTIKRAQWWEEAEVMRTCPWKPALVSILTVESSHHSSSGSWMLAQEAEELGNGKEGKRSCLWSIEGAWPGEGRRRTRWGGSEVLPAVTMLTVVLSW